MRRQRSKGINSSVRRVFDRTAALLTHTGMSNVISVIALTMAGLSLFFTYDSWKQSEIQKSLSLVTDVELVKSETVYASELPHSNGPYPPPYILLPVRVFVMNASSLPQSIIGLSVSFDGGPQDKRAFVTLPEPASPVTLPPGETRAVDVQVPFPVDAAILRRLLPAAHGPPVLRTAGDLLKRIDTRFSDAEKSSIRKEATFSLRLMSPSPGLPRSTIFGVVLP